MSDAPLGPMPGIPQLADLPEDGVWRRLSPRMLLIHPVREIIRFLPALIAVLFAGSNRGNSWWGLAVTALAVAAGIARWFTTRFRFTQAQVQLRSGLIQRTTVSAPADRVRSVDVTAPILHRLLGLAEVKIGTGAGEKEMKLDGLTAHEAAALRADLLHHSRPVASQPGIRLAKNDGSGEYGESDTSLGESSVAAVEAPEEVLYTLNPAWLRFAPFSPSGLIAALAIFGLSTQLLQDTGVNPVGSSAYQGVRDTLMSAGVVIAIVIGAVGLLILTTLLSLIAYTLAFYNFRLTRSGGGETFHVARGLLTRRATSLEVRRLRGVEMHEPVPLRWVGGARLRAITTGVKDEGSGMSALLTPPSPADVVRRTADLVLDAPGQLHGPLQQHGPAARNRRWTRALSSSAVLAAGIIAGAWWLDSWWWTVLAAGVLVAAWPLAISRYAALGHRVSERFVVGRSGALRRSTFVLQRSGVVAVTTRQSIFQRRSGVCSVLLASAAGEGSYTILDVTQSRAGELVEEVSGGLSRQFSHADGSD